VIDTPPVLPVPDVPLLMPLVDAVVLVARNGFSRSGAFRDLLAAIGTERVLGAFLNESNPPRHHKYYGYYGEKGSPAAAAEGPRGDD
jgi:Mrp family chromosome partitioning ATPase